MQPNQPQEISKPKFRSAPHEVWSGGVDDMQNLLGQLYEIDKTQSDCVGFRVAPKNAIGVGQVCLAWWRCVWRWGDMEVNLQVD